MTQENEKKKWYVTYLVMRLLFGGQKVHSIAEVSLEDELYRQDWRDIEEWIETP